MLSTLKLPSITYIGRDEQKKLNLILTYLIDLPESPQFLHPVEWQDLQLNDYPVIVKHPMNLLKVQEKLKLRQFRTVQQVLDNIQLVWDNCKAYNREGHFFNLADKMQRAFKKMIKNYLPNIQVTVPKPTVTNTSHYHPPSQGKVEEHSPKPVSQPKTKTIPQKEYSKPQRVHSSFQEPISHISQPQNQIQPQQISSTEKNRFHQRLKQLTQQQLAQIVVIIQQNCNQGFKQCGNGRCQIMLDNIDSDTFRKMNERIDEMLEGQKGMSYKKIKVV